MVLWDGNQNKSHQFWSADVIFPYQTRWKFRISGFSDVKVTQTKNKGLNRCAGLDSPWELQEFETPRIFRQCVQESGEVVGPTHRLLSPRPQGSSLVFIAVGGWVDHRSIVRSEVLGQRKIPPSGMRPATFRLIAHYVIQVRYRVFVFLSVVCKNLARGTQNANYLYIYVSFYRKSVKVTSKFDRLNWLQYADDKMTTYLFVKKKGSIFIQVGEWRWEDAEVLLRIFSHFVITLVLG